MERLENITPKRAKEQQKELAQKIKIKGAPDNIRIVAGIDIAYHKKPPTGFCAISLFSYPDMKHIKTYTELDIIGYPYIPGLLTYREGDLILATLRKVEEDVDVYLFDGNGIAHPRRLGIASHIGLLIDKPSIGIGKSQLLGEYKEPNSGRGSASDWTDQGEIIGTVLRTQDDTNPIFVSPGHKIGIKKASEITLNCTTDYRIPEPLRKSDQEAEKYKDQGDI
ncbi:MAG: endonuclease V [Bacteroidales bacterium]|nr:endonuclease V [Bacteroidales bacterium]